MCFIDFEKAFDKIRHSKLLEILKQGGLDDKDIQIIKNLYWHQVANVRLGQKYSADAEIRRGVRQGCILSPLLFNIYSESIFNEALENIDAGIKVNGVWINNLRYADDTVLLASKHEDLQLLINRVTEISEKYGLKLNTSKTKIMVVSKQPVNLPPINSEGIPLEKVERITHLGSNLHESWDMTTEVKTRIEKARTAFFKMKKVFCSHDISLRLKIRLVRCYIFSILLYGVESWSLTEGHLKRLEAFEMWIYRRLLRISWVDKIRNEEVISRLGKPREIIKTIKKRKLEYFGHVMRHPEKYGILHLILQGKIEGKRGPGRRRTSWLQNLRDWFGQNSAALFRAAADKNRIANMIANVR